MGISTNVKQTSAFTLKENWIKFTYTWPIQTGVTLLHSFWVIERKIHQKANKTDIQGNTVYGQMKNEVLVFVDYIIYLSLQHFKFLFKACFGAYISFRYWKPLSPPHTILENCKKLLHILVWEIVKKLFHSW